MRIAILSSYTIDFLKDKLRLSLAKEFGKTDIYHNQFNQYPQEILNKQSALYSFLPEIIIFLFDGENWIKNQSQILELIHVAKRGLPQTIFLIGNAALFHSQILPSLQWNIKNSAAEQIADCNLKLAKLCQTHQQLFVLDINDLVQIHGRLTLFDQRMAYLTKSPWSQKGMEIISLYLTQQIAVVIGKRRKVIILDLDNTLWGGILGEDGIENLILSNDGIGKAYYDFQQNLLKLQKSGILLVICSKNDEKLALETIESHPYMLIKKHHLTAWRINWQNKAENLISLAQELNLGLDSFVFLDDSPHERKLIKSALPEIKVPDLPTDPSEYSEFLAKIYQLDAINITQEDKRRNASYQQEQIRASKQLSSASLEKFLQSLHIKVLIKRATSFTIPRIAQLTQKTNQFNLTTKRYTETQIRQLVNNKNTLVLTISAKDVIGDMGLVGVIITNHIDRLLVIDTFLMSCRVLGRGIEDAALFALTKYGNQLKTHQLIGEFIPTKKNGMAKDFFSNHHFTPQKKGLFTYKLKEKKIKQPSWITLTYG